VRVTQAGISGATRLAGILGDPVIHSLSPRMQNAAFAATGLDWVYVPLPVQAARLGDAVRGLLATGFAGANVTIPHKTAVLEHCDEVDEAARRAGSVNTLVFRDGRVLATSTDGLAVTSALDVRGRRALLLGAGGAAQAVATALAEAGVGRLRVAARRPEAARALAAHVRAAVPGVPVEEAAWPPDCADATLLLNATPLKEELPVAPHGGLAVVDLAYLPDGRETALVAAARAAGCREIVDGLEILVRQGAASFERWTGLPGPLDVMRAAVRA
jgi:shikimate dehydrogenase